MQRTTATLGAAVALGAAMGAAARVHDGDEPQRGGNGRLQGRAVAAASRAGLVLSASHRSPSNRALPAPSMSELPPPRPVTGLPRSARIARLAPLPLTVVHPGEAR
ncbi:hypothetical protein GUJ93_ZPchr0001g30784 [Zizania palustris]|uniref:Uncharacterized protein n=1 Tax=Zizania palustris TaxID=103762 RepID=A0A8J5RVY5_ZIZPA|nr:hypothetical protein GUJ93_ZPchr0001g30784 [Zizania palustris]